MNKFTPSEEHIIETIIDCMIQKSTLGMQFSIAHCWYKLHGKAYRIIQDWEIGAEISRRLQHEYEYAKMEGSGNEWYSLTEKGKSAKKAGGHFAFLRLQNTKIQNTVIAPSKNEAIINGPWHIKLFKNPLTKWIVSILTALLCAYIIFKLGWN